jgi:flavin reductase (DIM6/NTAB) family NADH-FMN oxidoreductase RutF
MSELSTERFREVAGHFPSGVTVITGIDGAGPTGFTCQSFHALSLTPPMALFAVAHTSTSWPRIKRSGTCCVNVLAASQEPLARTFAMSGAEKFAGVTWSPGVDGNPVLDGVVAWFACRLAEIHHGGDHELVTAGVVDLGAPGGEPLVFHRGGFASLGANEAF